MKNRGVKKGQEYAILTGEPMEIPNFGKYVSFLETEGNRNSIIQPVLV